MVVVINLFASLSWSKDFLTNEFQVQNAPSWVRQSRLEKTADSIQRHLEWSTRRVPLIWHSSEDSYKKTHSLRPLPLAVTIKSAKKTEIHLGPKVNRDNYQRIVGHELVHVIFFQKYRGSIPDWLEEGFANHLSKTKPVDYRWLAQQKWPADVTNLGHPFQQKKGSISLHYQLSQALVEMLKKKCDLDNLLRLSVERKMENKILNLCNISDINKALRSWVDSKLKK